MKIKFTIAILFGLVIGGQASASGFDPSQWLSKGEVSVNEVSEDGLVRILLGRPFVAITGLDPNVRIISSGSEVPYVRDTSLIDLSHRQSMPLSDSWKRDGSYGVIADTGKEGLIHDALSLSVAYRGNYKRQVSVYVSSVKYPVEDSRWRLVTDQGYIWNYTDDKAGFSASETNVTYPRQTSRYIKLVVHAGEGEIVNIPDVQFSNVATITESREEEFETNISVSEDLTLNETVVVAKFDDLEKLRSIRLGTPDTNFNRRVAISYYTERGEKVIYGAAYIFSVSTSLFNHSELEIPLNDIVTKTLELRIINEDNDPIKLLPQATVTSPIASIIAKLTKPGIADIYFNGRVEVPRYDLAAIVNYVDRNIPEAKATAYGENTSYKAPPKAPVPLSEKKIVFVPLIILAVLILGGFTFAYFLKLKSADKDPDNFTGEGNGELK